MVDTVVVHGVDAGGKYLGLVAPTAAYAQVPSAPPQPQFLWDFQLHQWKYIPTLADAIAIATNDINTAAVIAFNKYYPSITGLERLYSLKVEQATAYRAANYKGKVPSLVQAEATALGIAPQAAANKITAENDTYLAKLPPIEQLRVAGLEAVKVSLDYLAVQSAALNYVSQIKAL